MGRLAWTGGAEVVVDASPEAVYDLLTDVARVGDWSHEAYDGEWLDWAHISSGAVAGARFRARNRVGRNRWSRVCEVLTATPGREFSWKTVQGGPLNDSTLWRVRLEPVDGGTRIVQTYEVLALSAWAERFIYAFVKPHRDRSAALRADLERLGAVAAGRPVEGNAGTARDGKPMAGFLLEHDAMRQEFGLLATAAREELTPDRAALVEDQLAMVCQILHNHHTGEDDAFWPTLHRRVPSARAGIEELEADHQRIDPLLEAVADRSVPLAERAATMELLHKELNSHLDREERLAVPLARDHLTLAEWERAGQRALKEMKETTKVPVAFGWIASAAAEEERGREALAEIPAVARFLFTRIWYPAYQRRARTMYGANTPQFVTI